MKAKLYVTEAGLVLTDEDNKPLYSVKYQGENYHRYKTVTSGGRIPELDSTLRKAAELGVKELSVSVPGLDTVVESYNIRANQIPPPLTDERIKIMVQAGLVDSVSDALSLLHEFALKASEEKIKEEAARLDLHIIQIVSAIDDLDRIVNLLAARVREWYGLHFPELDSMLQDPRQYVRLVSVLGRRDNFTYEKLRELGISEEKAQEIERAAESSKGAEIRDEELELLRSLASQTYNAYQLRLRFTSQLEELMRTVAPNVTNLVGATIGARLIAKAGGLDELAKLPASTIQVLGAEKALFRALRRGGRPPKHGIIFQHPLVHSSPRWQRGKIARTLAAKLAIAARLDYYSGVLDPTLKEKFEERVKEIKRKYPKPPVKAKGKSLPAKKQVRKKHGRNKRRPR